MFLIPSSWYEIVKTKRKGRGVLALHDIEAGTVIGDYLGTIIKAYSHDEKKYGLYDMQAGTKYDILGNPKLAGIPLINHSCANNCDLYPYERHILYVAIRKIFKGEELSVNYRIGIADEKDISCKLHACHCGSKICTGSMHESEPSFDAWYPLWEKSLKSAFGKHYKKMPEKFGVELDSLKHYPASVKLENQKLYESALFGSEKKPPETYLDRSMPPLAELRKRIRATGRQLSFPKLHLTVYGIRNGILLTKRI